MIHHNSNKKDAGFALLITILVLSVVVAVTLAIVELSIKQLKLSVDSKDSEIAFHAANAGLECVRYTRRQEATDFESGANVTFDCFGDSVVADGTSFSPISPSAIASARATRYKVEIEWGSAPAQRCTVMDVLAVVATSSVVIGNGTGVDSLKNHFAGYENDTKTCAAGERCTIISSIGYSSACADITASDTLKREILLEL